MSEIATWEDDGGKLFVPLMKNLPVSMRNSTRRSTSSFCGNNTEGLTKRQVNAGLRKHNDKVKKMYWKNWSMPIVYGGYNTK